MPADNVYRLYKYRSLSNRSTRDKRSPRYFTERLVRYGKLYYGRPSSLNDPFECRWSVVLDGAPLSQEALERSDELVAHSERFMWEHTDRDFAVFSLAEEPDNVLMWSHYSDCHTGICVELTFSTEEPLHKIRYSVECAKFYFADLRPQDRNVERYHRSIMDTLTTKATDWQYEKEWRCIYLVENGIAPHGEKDMPRGTMTGIIFGYRTSEDDQKRVRQWVNDSGERPQFYQAALRPGQFALDIVPID